MQRARLEITKTKDGKFAVNVLFADGKRQTVPDLKLKDDTLNGKEVEVLREKGQIIKIICEGRILYEKRKSTSYPKEVYKQTQKENSGNSFQNIYSRAPYNFIPLNDKVVPSEGIPEFDRYDLQRFTGYIDIELKTLTPLYIRDTLTDDEYKQKLEIENYTNSNFFSPGDLIRIPGSSLRGMIRTMVEIMSFGKFGFFDDSRLYYRGLADKSSLRKEYQARMSSFDKNSKKTQYKMSAGILIKKGFNYFIIPAKGFTQIPKEKAREMIKNIGKSYEEFKFYKLKEGYIIVSGPMQNKKMDWFIEFPQNNAKEFMILEEDIQNYKNDKNRSERVPDLLKLARDGVPCFYVRYRDSKNVERISFGHTGMFRLAYEKTIGDHIPEELKKPNITDLAEAIFGNEKTYAGRVFFEDAYLEGNPEDALLHTATPHILSGPKPTCFQHYLEQKPENLVNHPKNLAHYNSNNPIRGHKLYWHRSGNNWIEVDQENIKKHPTQYTRITPVKPCTVFRGRIRFENLSKVELGALLFALQLPEGCAHKIGMGKPLGLGSVRITPKLYLSDRMQRYTDLFAEWNGLEEKTDEVIKNFKKAFESYILNKLNEEKTSIWELERMQELKRMLDFDKKPDDDKTEYLPLNEFRHRKVLPSPTKV